jgi:hypothetical protein
MDDQHFTKLGGKKILLQNPVYRGAYASKPLPTSIFPQQMLGSDAKHTLRGGDILCTIKLKGEGVSKIRGPRTRQ